MKKTLLIALMLFAAGFVSAQDMELIRIIEPDGTAPINNNDTITIRFEMRNNGPGALSQGETYSGQLRLGATANPITLNGLPLQSQWDSGQVRTVSLIQNYAMNGTSNGSWEVCAWINSTSQYGADPTPANDTACASYTVQDPPPPASVTDISAVAEGFHYGNGVLSYNFITKRDSTRIFSLMNLTGQVVWRKEVIDSEGMIDVDVEHPGIYLLLMEGDGAVESKKVFVE